MSAQSDTREKHQRNPRPALMRFRLFSWRMLLSTVGLALYLAGYGYFRAGLSMVHRIGTSGDTCTGHSVAPGNAWFLGSDFNNWLALAYTPLRLAETSVWYIIRPPGTKLLHRHLESLPR
jgi:hypothetical protein